MLLNGFSFQQVNVLSDDDVAVCGVEPQTTKHLLQAFSKDTAVHNSKTKFLGIVGVVSYCI